MEIDSFQNCSIFLLLPFTIILPGLFLRASFWMIYPFWMHELFTLIPVPSSCPLSTWKRRSHFYLARRIRGYTWWCYMEPTSAKYQSAAFPTKHSNPPPKIPKFLIFPCPGIFLQYILSIPTAYHLIGDYPTLLSLYPPYLSQLHKDTCTCSDCFFSLPWPLWQGQTAVKLVALYSVRK